jgi:hypothetical protein
MKAHTAHYTQQASNIWKRNLLAQAALPNTPPSNPLQTYLQIAHTDIQRKDMTKPAQYLAQNSHLPLQALFRARLQHTKTLLCTQPPNDNFRPYDTLTCPRCYPQPNHYALHTHLPKDNIIHLILKCPTTSQPAQTATTKISNIMQDFGIEPPWNLTQPTLQVALLLGAPPPTHWNLKKTLQQSWTRATLGTCAALAMGCEQKLP